MLALRKVVPSAGLALEDVVPPTPDADEVVIAIAAAGICGSDLHVDAWTISYAFMSAALPVTLGHEFAGTVVEVGADATCFSIGDRVVVMPSVTCGVCPGCVDQGPDGCTDREGLGMTRNGAFASHAAVPAINCIPLPAALSFELAALTEPLTVSAQAVARGGIGPGSRVLVMGPGTIGQGVALLARREGAAAVVVTGFEDAHRFATLRALGFTDLVDVAEPGAPEQLRAHAATGFDVVVEASGAPSTVGEGLALLRSGGTLVLSGIHGRPVEIDATAMVRRNLQLRGSYRAPRAQWPDIVAMLAEHGSEFLPMITHRLPLAQAHEGFSLARSREASKVLLCPNEAF